MISEILQQILLKSLPVDKLYHQIQIAAIPMGDCNIAEIPIFLQISPIPLVFHVVFYIKNLVGGDEKQKNNMVKLSVFLVP